MIWHCYDWKGLWCKMTFVRYQIQFCDQFITSVWKFSKIKFRYLISNFEGDLYFMMFVGTLEMNEEPEDAEQLEVSLHTLTGFMMPQNYGPCY